MDKENKVKPKGYIKDDDTKLKILFSIYQVDKPLRAVEIAKYAKLQRNLVKYHLGSLIGRGLLLPIEDDDGVVRYSLQPIFVREDLFKEIMSNITPIINKIASNMFIDHINPDEVEPAIKDNFLFFLKILDFGIDERVQ